MSKIINIINEEIERFNLNETIRSTNTTNRVLDLNKKYNVGKTVKPNGLWYEIDGDWIKKCSIDMPHMIRKYNIILDIDLTNILVLDSYEKGVIFYEKFNKDYGHGQERILWEQVVKSYKGIEIPNIEILKRDILKDTSWVVFWDVNSGCIWDLSAIKNYELSNCKKNK